MARFEYTKEITARMTGLYAEQNTAEARAEAVKALATEFKLKEAQVRGKLVREGVYVAPTRARKTVAAKAIFVAAIAEQLGMLEEVAETLEKANKPVLAAIYGALNAKRELEGEEVVGLKATK